MEYTDHSCEADAISKELIYGLVRLARWNTSHLGNHLNVNAFTAVGSALECKIDLPGSSGRPRWQDIRVFASFSTGVSGTTHGRIRIVRSPGLCTATTAHLRGLRLWWSTGVVQVDGRDLQEVELDLVEILDRTNAVGANMSLAIELLQIAQDSGICVFTQGRVPDHRWSFFVFTPVLVGGSVLLDLDGAGAVLHLVCRVCRLVHHITYLSDKGDLAELGAVNYEVCVVVGRGPDDLLYCDGAKSVSRNGLEGVTV